MAQSRTQSHHFLAAREMFAFPARPGNAGSGYEIGFVFASSVSKQNKCVLW